MIWAILGAKVAITVMLAFYGPEWSAVAFAAGAIVGVRFTKVHYWAVIPAQAMPNFVPPDDRGDYGTGRP